MSTVAVFYLARLKEGFGSFDAFAQSLRRHPAGLDHDLIIICKGFRRQSELAVLSDIFKGIPHQLTMVDDEIGQDIRSYKLVAPRFPHQYMCFMNTFTQINADHWLKKMFDAMSLPNVGMVGATASFESLHSSWQLLNRVEWLAKAPARYDQDMAASFEWILKHFHPVTAAAVRSRSVRLRRLVGDVRKRRPKIDQIVAQHYVPWGTYSAKGGPFHWAAKYPFFPNPHIRSNAFLLRREDIIGMPMERGNEKVAGCNFESGPNGLSSRMIHSGKRLLLVGANGQAYDIDQWPDAGIFRIGNQANLLISDNQTRSFNTYSEAEKKTHSIMAWGSYAKGNPDSIYGVKFDSTRPLTEFSSPPIAKNEERLLSIVIPTHNRLALVLDAIKTVRQQNYQNWEISVFDNASSDDVTKAVEELGDSRIRCARSDEFLAVTDSWNSALEMARGEYVTLIGDDDGLAPGFFERIAELADRFGNPDVIYSSLYQFFHPGVLPERPLGVVQTLPTADFMRYRDYPFVLDKASAKRAVDGSLGLRRTFMFNMPAMTIRRDFLQAVSRGGKILHPPFPDYYIANLVFDKAEKIVVEPRGIAFQGVSRSSFGFTLFNQKTDEGFKVLGHKLEQDSLFGEVGHHLLPGPGYNSQYIMTMAHLAKAMDDRDRQPDFQRYRQIQIFSHLASHGFSWRWGTDAQSKALWDMMSMDERIWAWRTIALHRLNAWFPGLKLPVADAAKDMAMHSFTPAQYVLNDADYVSGPQVFTALAEGRLDPFNEGVGDIVQFVDGDFVDGIRLDPGTRVSQTIALAGTLVDSISFKMYSYEKIPTDYRVDWTISSFVSDQLVQTDHGKILTSDYREWEKNLLLPYVAPEKATSLKIEIFVNPDQVVTIPVFLPLYHPIDREQSLVEVNNKDMNQKLVIGLHIKYQRLSMEF